MNNQLVVYGAGGHGKVVAEILGAMDLRVEGFIDDDSRLSGSSVLSLPVFAASQWLRTHSGASVALGIGDNLAREQAALRVKQHDCRLTAAIHPAAVVAKSARIGEAVAIMAAAVLNADCNIGEGAIVNTGAIVEHDVRIGQYAHLSPNCATGGGAFVGDYSHIGMGASVLPLKRVGANCVIGAGAIVIDDIADGQTAYGVPAKVRLGEQESP